MIGEGPNQWSAQEIKLAMALLGKNRHYLAHTIQRRHFNSTARQLGVGADVEALLEDLVSRTPGVIAEVQRQLPPGFSQKVADSVLGGLAQSARRLEAMPAA